MDDAQFEHMLKLSATYIPVLKGRELLGGVRDMTTNEIHNTNNCLEIVADTFLEMQRRLEVARLTNQHKEGV